MEEVKREIITPITDILTDSDFKEIEAAALKKARFVSLTQEFFELSFSKFYMEMMQEKVFQKKNSTL